VTKQVYVKNTRVYGVSGVILSVALVDVVEGFPANFVNDGDVQYFTFPQTLSILHPVMNHQTLLFPSRLQYALDLCLIYTPGASVH